MSSVSTQLQVSSEFSQGDFGKAWDFILRENISNSKWTEWSTISKSDEREARGRFDITSTITPRIARHEVQLLINRIYNKFWNSKCLLGSAFEQKHL